MNEHYTDEYYMNSTGFQSYLFYFQSSDTKMIKNNKLYFFFYVEHGVCTVRISDKIIKVYPGQIFFIPPEINYKLTFDNEEKKYCTGQVLRVRFFAGVNKYDYSPQVFEPTKKMLKILKDIPVSNNNLIIEINCQYLAKIYTFLSLATEALIRKSEKQTMLIKKSMEYMRKNLRCSIDDIAKYCNISRSYLFKTFKEHLGTTPIKIKQKIQAEEGEKLLLNTNLSVESIATEVGFESVAHFRNVFYSRFVITPGKYRKKHTEQKHSAL